MSKSEYLPTIGLEIHAELKTKTKMFCGCLNNPDEEVPNTNICPVCMAHPGSLPVINKEAVRKVLLVGSAVGAELADYTEFDRKNYFDPDIPKGYQISQYAHPLVQGGSLNGVALTRIHLEEDTASSTHSANKSLVDFNRAGVPLMELVTEPVIHSGDVAGAFARELQLLLRYLGAGEANMEKGEMRVEANISVSKDGTLGTKVEVKNLNSFRSVERAIAFEVARQIKTLEEGGVVVQETRGWDEVKQSTFSQRKKESSHDYRYFPDPDLPKLLVSETDFTKEKLISALPELPRERREKYVSLGLKKDDADMFVSDPLFGDFFDAALTVAPASAMLIANYLASDIAGALQKGGVTRDWLSSNENASRFAELLELVRAGELSSRGAKDTLTDMFTDTRLAKEIATAHNRLQQHDASALEAIAEKVIEANPTVAADYRAGKQAALQFLIGQGMKESKGAANPATLKTAFEKLLV